MTIMLKCSLSIFALLCAASPTYAGPCAPAIARVQARVDATIEKRAAADGWKVEGVRATRNYQPTPWSLAATEGRPGQTLDVALDSLDRARAADSAGDIAVCRQALASAKVILRSLRH